MNYLTTPFFYRLAQLIFLLALAGCSAIGIESKQVDYKTNSAKVPSLDVPPDLTELAVGDRYVIPDSGGEIVASYSEYSKADPVRQPMAQSAVLPSVPNVYLERSGVERWLVVRDTPDNVWQKVKAFWQESGFTIQTDNPEAGLIETDWAENRAKIPQGGLRAVVGKVFDKLYTSGEKDRYRTRLERKKEGNSTEIYIRHRGMAEVFNADKSTSVWQARPNDPEMEAAMLQLLMVRLGGSTTAQSGVQESPSAALGEITPELQVIGKGMKSILLKEPFDKCWRRVGLALEKANIAVTDRDRSKGLYFVNMSTKIELKKSFMERLKFWRNDEVSKVEPYQVIVFEADTICRVNVTNKDESKDETAIRIIDLLYQKLSK